jgi:hypothetical protein
MANTGKDASGSTIFLWNPLGSTGVDDTNSYPFGSVLGYSRNGSKQHAVLDISTPTNNRPPPVVILAGDGLAPLDVNTGAAGTTTLRTVLADRHSAAATPLALRLSDGSAFLSALPVVTRVPALVTMNTLTRPANATAYTVNSALSDSTTAPTGRTFANAVLANGGGGRIERAVLKTSSTTWTGSIRLYLFRSSAVPTATNDNAAYTPSGTSLIGWIDFNNFGQGISEGILSCISAMPFSANGSTTSIFGLLQNKSAPTPASGQTFDVDLWIDQV